jgi:5-methylcytosine-specific restriction endonuclease McrA
MELRQLTDQELFARLGALAAQERESVADVVEHLSELDRRANVAKTGHATLFDYCRRALRYSEHAAFLRIRAARAVRGTPRLLDDLRSGRIHLDAVARLAPHLTPQNSDSIISLASGASKLDVMTLVAQLGGESRPPQRDVILPLPRAPGAERVPASGELPEVIAPPESVRIAFTADGEMLSMLERLKSAWRHRFPEGRLEDVIRDACAQCLARMTPRPRRDAAAPARTGPRSRRIPAAVKAQVRERDKGRCVFVGPDGTVCGSAEFIQFDHIIPWSDGGPSTADNVRLLCRAHNLWRAKERFGPRRRKRAQVCTDTPAHGPAPRDERQPVRGGG